MKILFYVFFTITVLLSPESDTVFRNEWHKIYPIFSWLYVYYCSEFTEYISVIIKVTSHINFVIVT